MTVWSASFDMVTDEASGLNGSIGQGCACIAIMMYFFQSEGVREGSV